MMGQIETYCILWGIIILIGAIFQKSLIPISLLLVVVGVLLSFLPQFPAIELNPSLVLNIFLPLLIYQICVTSSWRDYKTALRPITLLSIGHVIFIAGLIAVVIHALIPQISWPMAFLLGAVISPPDDVAMVTIAEKVHMPRRIVTILKGEGIFNDATALTLFKFSLAAVLVHEFSAIKAVSDFFLVIIGETLYGFILGNLLGKIRLRLRGEPALQTMVSLLTPFLAYLPAERLGGCGVLATVVTGLIIEHKYSEQFSTEVRLLARSVWKAMGFILEKILFLLVGLEMRFIIDRMSSIPTENLLLYALVVILVVIVGRFCAVFPFAYIPRLLFPSIRKREPKPPWQYAFIVSWAGMRGGISLAAALAIPTLPSFMGMGDPRDFIVFLVFCVILATLLLQGLTFPWMLKILGMHEHGKREKKDEHLSELSARELMVEAVLDWLSAYKEQINDQPKLLEKVERQIQKYERRKERLLERMEHSDDLEEEQEVAFLPFKILEIERAALLNLWHEEKINHTVKNRLQENLDYRLKGRTE